MLLLFLAQDYVDSVGFTYDLTCRHRFSGYVSAPSQMSLSKSLLLQTAASSFISMASPASRVLRFLSVKTEQITNVSLWSLWGSNTNPVSIRKIHYLYLASPTVRNGSAVFWLALFTGPLFSVLTVTLVLLLKLILKQSSRVKLNINSDRGTLKKSTITQLNVLARFLTIVLFIF